MSAIAPDQKPLHVVMTADTVGSVWTYAVDFARGLALRDVRTTLVVLGAAPDEKQRAGATAIEGLTLIPFGGELDWTAADAADVDVQGIRLAMLAAQLRPDIVHLNSPALGANARFPCPVLAGCHACLRTWWLAVKGEMPLPGDLAWRVDLTARGYASADMLVAPSAAFAAATQAAYDLAQPPRVVLNGRPPPAEIEPSSETPGSPFAFFAGQLWDEGKGMAVMDQAAAQLAVPVFAAGRLNGPNGAAMTVRSARLLGQVSEAEMAGWLAARPIFVSTALYEPFGLAVLEAAMAGCPLVLSDIATFRELWDGCAIFTPPGDARAVAKAVEDLANDEWRRGRMGVRARQRAAGYTLNGMIDGALALYRELIAGAERRRGATSPAINGNIDASKP